MTQPNTVNCYPNCSEESITKKLLKLNPCIDINTLSIETLLQFQNEAKKSSGNTTNPLKDLIELYSKKSTSNVEGKDGKLTTVANDDDDYSTLTDIINEVGNNFINNYKQSDDFKVFDDIYGFLSLMNGVTENDGSFVDIPIFSSPNISVTHGNGYESEQSLFSFVQSIITSGSKFFGGVGGVLGGITNTMEWLSGLAGISPRLSPYFSFKANPFASTPTLSIETKLINDSEESVKSNNKFLNTVIRKSLIRSSTFNNSTSATTGSIWNKWIPPKLFNVSLKWGAGGSIVKRFHLCKLNSSVTPEGLMRKYGNLTFPDAYHVSLTFQSLLPDTGDTWSDANAWGDNSTFDNTINNLNTQRAQIEEEDRKFIEFKAKVNQNALNAGNLADRMFWQYAKIGISHGMDNENEVMEYARAKVNLARANGSFQDTLKWEPGDPQTTLNRANNISYSSPPGQQVMGFNPLTGETYIYYE